MTITETILYLAAFLKFSAVPSGALELIKKERRDAFESWLMVKLPKLIRSFGITLLVLLFCVFLLVKAGPHLVLIYFLSARLIGTFIMYIWDSKKVWPYIMRFAIVLSVAASIAAVLEKWVFPESWVLAIAYPFEVFSAWANGIPYVGWVLPDYSAKGFLNNFREFFIWFENWLWDWLAFLSWGYFFVARGFMLLTVILIQILFFLSVILGLLLAIGFPVHLFIKVSDYLRLRLRLEKDRIPVGAFILWAIGEGLEFGLKSIEYFQKCCYRLFH